MYKVNVYMGTLMECSHLRLPTWLLELMGTARKGISSIQLAKALGIIQKSAWFFNSTSGKPVLQMAHVS